MIIGALDPGSAHAGVAVGSIAATIDVDAADVAPAADAIVALLVAHGATQLIVEWSRFYPSPNPGRAMAQAEQYPIMQGLVRAVANRCRAVGIRVADDEAIRKVRGRAWRTGLVARSTWCRWIGARAAIDPATGKPRGVPDSSVREALQRVLVDLPEHFARLRNTHERDAVGLLIGWQHAAEERAAAEVLERQREVIAAQKAAEVQRNRPTRKRVYSPEQRAYKALVGRLWYRKRGKALRRVKYGHKPRNDVWPRLRALLAKEPLCYSDIARAFGARPVSFGATFYPYVRSGAVVKLPPGERVPGRPGRVAAVYALATAQTAAPQVPAPAPR